MHSIDEAILLSLARFRSPLLNKIMIDLTSLGSTTIAVLVALTAFGLLWSMRNRRAAARILTVTVGAEVWIEIAKRMFGRPRPSVVPYLVEFTGWSFPSGHTLMATATYLTLAAVVCRYTSRETSRLVVWTTCWTIVGLVALSRVYLGVHYPSDVAGGVLFGLLWFYLAGFMYRKLPT